MAGLDAYTKLHTVQDTFQPMPGHISRIALGKPVEIGTAISWKIKSGGWLHHEPICEVAFV